MLAQFEQSQVGFNRRLDYLNDRLDAALVYSYQHTACGGSSPPDRRRLAAFRRSFRNPARDD